MDPKISPESEIAPLPPTSESLTPEAEVWEPPFERWMRLADTLLRQTPIALPKGSQRDSKIPKQ